VSWMLTQGQAPHSESSMGKVYGSEHFQHTLDNALKIMGLYGQLQTGSKRVPFKGKLERWRRVDLVLTFGGGANEVLRDMVAMLGLGMPPSRSF